jgi:hypothetical protein
VTKDIKYFHDLVDIPGYGKGNVFDVIFLQDTEDFNLNKNEYHNIESFENKVNLDCYNPNVFTTDIREKTEIIVKEFFKPNGPATHFGLLSNFNIDEVLDQLTEKFPDFLHLNFGQENYSYCF